MTLVLQDDGIIQRLDTIRVGFNSAGIRLHLFQNDVVPDTASVIGDFTECDFAGYADSPFNGWNFPVIAAGVGFSVTGPFTFTRSTTGPGQFVFGYYVTKADNVTLLWAERDPVADTTGPVELLSAGDSYTVIGGMSDQDLST